METLKIKVINWFLDLSPVKKVVYTRLFRQATEDVLATIKDDSEKKAKIIAEEQIMAMLSPVDTRKILTFDAQTKSLKIGGIKADPSRLANLKSEAEFLLQSDIWQILYETPKELAHKALFSEGENVDFFKKGRAMIFTLETQKKNLNLLASVTVHNE